MNGADLFCSTLESLGVNLVFGVAGTQNIEIFEALRKSNIQIIAATHEMAAAFMAVGYFRTTGKPGVVLTIPGPGFTFALPAIAEARLDSCAVVFVSGKPTEKPSPQFQLQDIDQCAMAAPLVKSVLNITNIEKMQQCLAEAFQLAGAGEPGPVFVEIARSTLRADAAAPAMPARKSELPAAPELLQIFELLKSAKRPALIVGQGVNGGSQQLKAIAARTGAPVFLTTSGRGALAEDHAQSFPMDRAGARVDALNQFLASCDLVLAVGIKFTHNGSLGFRLKLSPETLIHVDAAQHVINANYPARLVCNSDAPAFFDWLETRFAQSGAHSRAWSEIDILTLRAQLLGEAADPGDPRFPAISPPTAATFYTALRRALPRNGIVVTDSGLHQLVARRNFTVFEPRTFIIPTDFQSMGFAIPAATAARAAFPDRPVVALLGDAGFAMMGLELLVAKRDGIALTVIVMNDRQAGLIRVKQIQEFGHAHGTVITNPDFAQFAASIGVGFVKIGDNPESALRTAIESDNITIVEVELEDAASIRNAQWKHAARDVAGRIEDTFKRLL